MTPRRLLITGGSGTLGFSAIRQFVSTPGFQVFAPVRRVMPFLEQLGPGVEFIVHDLKDEPATLRLVRRKPAALAEVFNLGSGRADSIRDTVERVCRELNLKVDLRFGDSPLPAFEPSCLVADITRARRELGWEPSTNLAYAVWQLAKEVAPSLHLSEPAREFARAGM